MKIQEPHVETINTAANGSLVAIETLLRTIQPGVFNLSIRMLGHRNDAEDATQEILLKVITHLSSFRAESQFSTWVFRITRNHLLNVVSKRDVTLVSLEQFAEKLNQGLIYGQSLEDSQHHSRVLTPEEKVEARHVAINCTQNMLMALDQEDRLTYLLDVVFGLSSKDAASVLEISPEAFRQRLSRVRAKLEVFVTGNCGLMSPEARCRCDRQIAAVRYRKKIQPACQQSLAESMQTSEWEQAEQNFLDLVKLTEAAAIFRAHPEYRASEVMIPAIRNALKSIGLEAGDGK
jgi:RNA polymerase sigma factor (sigma-70 family)